MSKIKFMIGISKAQGYSKKLTRSKLNDILVEIGHFSTNESIMKIDQYNKFLYTLWCRC